MIVGAAQPRRGDADQHFGGSRRIERDGLDRGRRADVTMHFVPRAEFASTLRADEVLQRALRNLPNIDVITDAVSITHKQVQRLKAPEKKPAITAEYEVVG